VTIARAAFPTNVDDDFLSSERELRESAEKYRTIFNLANDAIFLHDATGRIVDVNQKMTEMYGYTHDEAVALSVGDLSSNEPPYTQERAVQLLTAARKGTPQLFEWSARHRSGRLFWVEVNLKLITIGETAMMLASVRDITDRKLAQAHLQQVDEQLREQASLVTLGQMAAVVAHEVRNPLAGVRGAIQVIGSRLPAGSRDAAIVSEVIARLDALDELMTDMLLFARPPHASPVLVDIRALADETSNLVAQDVRSRNVQFTVDGTRPVVKADPKLLKSVLLNLLLNAADAVQGGGSVRTSIATTAEACVITVIDSGPGIPAEIRERIFVPFFTTKSRGTGLGLPTAKRLVEAHGGRIRVTCPSDGGTTVTIELPRT
jgi:PAS domain S-box-containing protein